MHKKKSRVRLSGKIEKAFEFFTGKLGVRVDLLSIRSTKCTDRGADRINPSFFIFKMSAVLFPLAMIPISTQWSLKYLNCC